MTAADASTPTVYAGSREGVVYAIDAETGESVWTFTEPAGEVNSSPTVVRGIVYVGSDDGTLYAIDAATGEGRWTFADGNGPIRSSPTVVEDTVYVGTGGTEDADEEDAAVYAIDAETGDERWAVTDPTDGVDAAPAVRDGTVYAGSQDGTLYAIEAETGEVQWQFTDRNGPITAAPTVADGIVYVGARGTHDRDYEDGGLYAVDGNTGEAEWSRTVPELLRTSAPTVVDGTVVVTLVDRYIGHDGDADGVYAFDAATGEQQWAATDVNLIERSSPTVADGAVYVWSGTTLTALDAATGARSWEFTTGDETYHTMPTVADGVVYAGHWNGSMWAFDASTGDELWQFTDTADAGTSVGIGTIRSSPTVVNDPDAGHSFDSRVRRGTLGHHHEWAGVDLDDREPTDENGTESDETGDDDRPSPTGTAAYGDRLADATVVETVTIDGDEFLVLENVPDEPADRYAYADDEYRLLEPAFATDVAISHAFCESYTVESDRRLEYTDDQHERFDRVETLARIANVLAELSGAIALAKIDPLSSASHAMDALQTAVEWGEHELTDPYYEQYAKMAASSSTIDWADDAVPDAGGSLVGVGADAIEIAQTSLGAVEAASSVEDVAQSASTVRDVVREADSIRDSVSIDAVNSVGDLRQSGYTVIAGLATQTAVDGATNVAEAQAKIGALGAGNAAARRPLLHELLDLEARAREYELGPAGILRMQAFRQTDYQLEAAAFDAIGTIQSELSDGRLGSVYDAVLDTDGIAADATAIAEDWRDLSQFTMVATGTQIDRGLERYERSLNEYEYGEQEVFDHA